MELKPSGDNDDNESKEMENELQLSFDELVELQKIISNYNKKSLLMKQKLHGLELSMKRIEKEINNKLNPRSEIIKNGQ